jgi:transglutaminase-like putative cysteine protease
VLEAVRDLVAASTRSSPTTARHRGVDAAGEVLRAAARRVPGLRPLRHRLPALARLCRALRERLPAHASAAGQAKLVGADASHAWFATFVPEYGWVDFDPTNN